MLPPVSRLRFAELDSQLAQVSLWNFAGRVAHQIGALRRLGEGYHFANRSFTRQDHHQAVESQRDSAVRRRAVFESVEQKAEAFPCFFVAEAERRENFGLHVAAMNSNRAGTKL